MIEIPLIDLGRCDEPDTNHPALVAEIDRAARTVGFLAVIDPAFPAGLRETVLDHARLFFALDLDEKREIAIEHSEHHRGYAGIEGELLQPGLRADLKETLDFGMEVPADDPDRSPLEGPNQWPDIVGFRAAIEAYSDAALATGRRVLRHMAEALEVDTGFFDERLARPLVGTRLVHYPNATEQVIRNQLGCGAHSDYGCVTVLATDGTAGLQLRDRDDVWHHIAAPPGAFIINFGDMLERWTNGRYKATPHRVISPAHRHRYSIPVFINPAYDTLVETFDSCLAPGDTGFDPITAGAYLERRFDETFTYRGADADAETDGAED
ncbi:MAG: 2-oxoglutarate and iron-dependent oxygenase domain-containing protein [Actinomycetota bacterium]